MLEALSHGSLLACSDGSYNPITNTAAYGTVIGTAQRPLLAWVKGHYKGQERGI
jgi:starvation-inducible outer membrane lipoprotein